ncbi:hypothetical protein [Mesorhizobium japonicum]|uniref:Msr9519 protein n=1 Tax=Mesorhizobium japonicum (strain LMG 29417 / CECT 9101 / MAFF 303099) TaxID=266835 RepID=Q98PC4_RHILO|nr:hypothetical protein [Mesorhizobium japonicum]BAB54731.1 msr9519 [Mesorhizobium japonicum MAFF 303099]
MSAPKASLDRPVMKSTETATHQPQALYSNGAAIVVGGDMIGVAYGISALTGGVLYFCLRFMAIRYGWRLPVAHLSARGRAAEDASDDEKPH